MDKSYIVVYNGLAKDLENELKKNNLNDYIILNDKIASIYTNKNFNENKFKNIKHIGWWQRSSPMTSLIELTNKLDTGETISRVSGIEFIEGNPYVNQSGKGVMIAIIDSGIDYLHPDFINERGETNIISIWDQESTKGNPPKGLLFGSEFSRSDINNAIKQNNKSLSEDRLGTGTIAAGICCGKGNVISKNKGIAINSELIVVKLREYRGRYDSNKVSYQTSDFLAAITYIENISKIEGKDVIINLTVGKSSSPGMEETMLDSFEFLKKAGVVVVSGAGNEGNTDIHYSGKFMDKHESQDILIQVGNQTNLEIFLYLGGPDKVGAQLISPSGEISYNVHYSAEDYPYRGKFNVENTKYEIQYVYPWFETGYEKLFIDLEDIKPGVWTLRLNPELIIEGEYDVYLPNKGIMSSTTRFLASDYLYTIGGFAAIDNIITVGTYNNIIDSMWISSSKGPIRESGIKPDIVAPGVDVISTHIGGEYNTATGTGVSSSIVCGVLAIIMEYIKNQSEYIEKYMYAQILKTYLILGATRKNIYKYPNPIQGYGLLNLKETITQISYNLEL